MKLLVAVPSHSQTIAFETALSLVKLQGACLARGWTFGVEFFSGTSIHELRNVMAGWFLASDWDAMLMLDADQGVEPEVVLRMADRNEPLVGCFYPRRVQDWSRVRAGETDIARARMQATPYVGTLANARSGVRSFEMVDGFARADFVGTGLLLMRREVFDRLKAAQPELRGIGFKADPLLPQGLENWGFFNPLVNPATGQILGEDYAFCLRWRDCGGEIWADVTSPSIHVGRHALKGAYIDHLMASLDVDIAPKPDGG